MSIHAPLSSEARKKLEAQIRASRLLSVVISILLVALTALALKMFLLPTLVREVPVFVTYESEFKENNEIEEKKVPRDLMPKPSAPSFSIAKVITASISTPISIPVPDVNLDTPSFDFGDGYDFGQGWGEGEGDSNGGGFSPVPATMGKRCSKGDRQQRLAKSGGIPACEEAVTKGLDWLQRTQLPDGSWCGKWKVGMTGLALLSYLGRCETPTSEKYGETVLKSIVYLTSLTAAQGGRLGTNLGEGHWVYEHAIATYALAEAQTMCSALGLNIPGLRDAVKTAGQLIIDNQHNSGSWDYGYTENPGRHGDNSIGAWHLQALKACKHTGIEFRNMSDCVRKALKFMQACKSHEGAIGYENAILRQPYSALAGAGALCFQIWGYESHDVVRGGCKYIPQRVPQFGWNNAYADLYALYYNAQAMLNRGGNDWTAFNSGFMPEVLANQNPDGSWKDVGGADTLYAVGAEFRGGDETAVHYRNCLAILTLEVYYRFLPGTGGGR